MTWNLMNPQRQPSKTSCGPASIAMLVDLNVFDVLQKLKLTRIGARRGKRSHGSNVGEIARLLRSYGYDLGRRVKAEPVPSDGLALLRISRPRGSAHWHWVPCRYGQVCDPANQQPICESLDAYLQKVPANLVSWYAVTLRKSKT